MEKNAQNKQKSNSEMVSFNLSKLSTVQYIKVIFIDNNQELREIRTEAHSFNNDIIQLYISGKENINLNYPTGVVLKLVTIDAIYFAKVILKDIKKANGKNIFFLNAPQKAIRQQNRKYYRINVERPCVLLINNDNIKNETFIAQSVNISKGGILIYNIESILNDEQIKLQMSQDDCCNIVMFLEYDLKVKAYAKFVRSECVDNIHRCAFQFLNIPQKYIIPFDKYLTNEEYKLLKSIKNK